MTSASRLSALKLSPGKLMGLRRISDASGTFRIAAIDQTRSFRSGLRKRAQLTGTTLEPGYAELRDCSLELTRALAGKATAVLLNGTFGAREAVSAGALPRDIGLIVRLEISKEPGQPAELEPGVTAEAVKRMGADAAKLLLYMDPEDAEFTRRQSAFLENVAHACAEAELLLMVEALPYPRPGESPSAFAGRRPAAIIGSAELISRHADVLKLPFPVGLDAGSELIRSAVAKLDAASGKPWLLLSAGIAFEQFKRQLEWAMKGGASGYMAGRAIFQEYFSLTEEEGRRFLAETAAGRMSILERIVEGLPETIA